MANLIDGKKIAAEMREECIARVARLRENGVAPRLDVVIVGDDPASHQYIGRYVLQNTLLFMSLSRTAPNLIVLSLTQSSDSSVLNPANSVLV